VRILRGEIRQSEDSAAAGTNRIEERWRTLYCRRHIAGKVADKMIHLLPLDAPTLDRLLAGQDAFLSAVCANWAEVRESVAAVAHSTRQHQERVGSRPPWVGYLAQELTDTKLVGACGFKGNPDAAGSVEIAYFTFPAHEGRGYATEMARRLIQIAWEAGSVQRVLAHSLPEINASGRVLSKIGMTKIGEVLDPEDGRVWRWEIRRHPAS
jgi:RimJ/RimL family protein N-acetyltransferase